MYKDILAAIIRSNETKTFCGIKKLYCTAFHKITV